jgi:hypothetical protein
MHNMTTGNPEHDYQLIAGKLYKLGDGILRRCVLEHECEMVLYEAHEGIAWWT